ncbi:sigma factor, partial [Nonomuraea sp. NPDC048916]|uniref:sigma factor n=1 Tax=Nonomuraea sp. NPDC048916 TaxID=3154232 RepID=UPI0033EF07A6
GFEAEDAVQETLVKAWHAGYDPDRAPLRSWLFRSPRWPATACDGSGPWSGETVEMRGAWARTGTRLCCNRSPTPRHAAGRTVIRAERPRGGRP